MSERFPSDDLIGPGSFKEGEFPGDEWTLDQTGQRMWPKNDPPPHDDDLFRDWEARQKNRGGWLPKTNV